jgi:predicted RNA polymerase sigma factor
MLYCDARKNARRDENGTFVPLSEQNPKTWLHENIDEAESLLQQASEYNQPGRFQLEASIQSAHSIRITGKAPDWKAIAVLYEGLVQITPTIGAWVSRAFALAEAESSSLALQELDALPIKSIQDYQPHFALRAHLLENLGNFDESEIARNRAAGLTPDPSVRAHLLRRR